MDAAELADRLGLNEGSVRKIGRTETDPRVERAIIHTDGRTYCMYRADCLDDAACKEPEEGGMIAEPTPGIANAQQGAS